jgi:hypothetical protein
MTLLQSAPVERDRFVSHLYQSRRACETAGKSGKQIERCIIASVQSAESMGFKGEFPQWEELGWRLITIRTPDPISSPGIEEAPHSAAY